MSPVHMGSLEYPKSRSPDQHFGDDIILYAQLDSIVLPGDRKAISSGGESSTECSAI